MGRKRTEVNDRGCLVRGGKEGKGKREWEEGGGERRERKERGRK